MKRVKQPMQTNVPTKAHSSMMKKCQTGEVDYTRLTNLHAFSAVKWTNYITTTRVSMEEILFKLLF